MVAKRLEAKNKASDGRGGGVDGGAGGGKTLAHVPTQAILNGKHMRRNSDVALRITGITVAHASDKRLPPCRMQQAYAC